MKLNLGCAEFYCHGWTNLDLHEGDGETEGLQRKPDIVSPCWDVPLPGQSCSKIYVGHLLEHLDLDAREPQRTLEECRRLLCSGGEIFVVGPDVVKYAERVHDGNAEWIDFWEAHGTRGVGRIRETGHEFVAGYGHRWNCTLEALILLVEGAGFRIEKTVLDMFIPWQARQELGWEPIVSGIPGQVGVLARK